MMRLSILLVVLSPILAQCQNASQPPAGIQKLANLDYIGAGNKRQMLDLYLPEAKSDKPHPLVVYIHGGGWENGSKDQAGVIFNLIHDKPYAGASINYRLTDQAIWPAQIHDCKAAIRWLRGHAKQYNLDPDKIAVFGISAGGHLVSMLGVTGGVKELEGDLGDYDDQSSRVTCVLDFCGPSNFFTLPSQGSVINMDDPKTAVSKLLGGTIKNKPATARDASPVTYLTSDDAPFLLIHGDKDPLVPYAQATEFDAALEKAKIPSILLTGTNRGHVFFSTQLFERMRAFLDRHLLGKDVQVPEGPVLFN